MLPCNTYYTLLVEADAPIIALAYSLMSVEIYEMGNGMLKTLVARDVKHQDGKVGIFNIIFSETIDDCSYRPGLITYDCRVNG